MWLVTKMNFLAKAKEAVANSVTKVVAVAVAAVALVTPALATGPAITAPDFTPAIEDGVETMTTSLSTVAPYALGALAVMLAFGIVWKLFKRAGKSV
jgi:hypothetical protein